LSFGKTNRKVKGKKKYRQKSAHNVRTQKTWIMGWTILKKETGLKKLGGKRGATDMQGGGEEGHPNGA